MQKNVSGQKLIVFAFNPTTGLPVTGDAANLTAYVSKDYGTVTVLGDTSGSELSSANAAGYYLFDLTQGETNADTLLFSAVSATPDVIVVGAPAVVFTTFSGFSGNVAQTGDSFARIGASGASLTSVAQASTALSTAQWTNALATNVGTTNTTVASNLDVVVSTRAASATALSTATWTNGLATNLGTLAAHDPGETLAGRTNITAGTITTVGTLTNPASLTSAYDFAKGTVAVTESYAANGAAPTPVQAVMAIHQMLQDFAISGTVYTVKKLDNSTTAFVCTLNSTTPTGIART